MKYSWLILICQLIVMTGCSEEKVGGKTASHFYEKQELINLCKSIDSEDLNSIESIVKSGIDINTSGKEGMTPLAWAYFTDKAKAFKKLLELKANPNISFKNDYDSLMSALAYSKNIDYLKMAIKHGGSVNYHDYKDEKHWIEPPIFEAILQNKIEHIKTLIKHGADINYNDGYDDTPLASAAGYENYHIVKFLIKNGADPLAVNIHKGKKKKNILLAVMSSGISEGHPHYQDYLDVVEDMKSRGAKVYWERRAIPEKYLNKVQRAKTQPPLPKGLEDEKAIYYLKN